MSRRRCCGNHWTDPSRQCRFASDALKIQPGIFSAQTDPGIHRTLGLKGLPRLDLYAFWIQFKASTIGSFEQKCLGAGPGGDSTLYLDRLILVERLGLGGCPLLSTEQSDQAKNMLQASHGMLA